MHRTPEFTPRQLENVPARAFCFLRAAGTSRLVRAGLAEAGYGPEDHAEGWRLLMACTGAEASFDNLPARPVAVEARADLERWIATTMRRCAAGLARRFPTQHAKLCGTVVDKLEVPVVVCSAFLDGLDALEREARSAGADDERRAALELVRARGVTIEERRRIRAVLEAATRLSSESREVGAAPEERATEEALSAMRAWLDDWGEAARTVVTRRDVLIQLGLARPRKMADPVATGTAGVTR